MAKKIVSIRVEDKTTLIVHMEYGTSNPTIYNCIRLATPVGTVEDGMILDAAQLGAQIKKACLEKKIRTKEVIFTIASSKIANREVEIPVVTKNRIQALVNAKATDYFPVDTSKYSFTFSNHGNNQSSSDGRVMELLVFAAPNELIDSYYDLAQAMNFHVLAMDSDGNSIFQMMKNQVSKGVAIEIHMNRVNTFVNIMSSDKLLLQRALPYGVWNVTEAMLNEPSFKVTKYEEALGLLSSQQVLWNSFSVPVKEPSLSVKKRVEITESLMDLVSNISRVIEYYNSKNKDNPIEELICTGVGASIVGMTELLTHELGIRTTQLTSLRGVKFAKKDRVKKNILQYVGCFGATIAPVRFVSKSRIEKEEKRSSSFSRGVVLGLAIILCVVMVGFSSMLRIFSSEANTTAQNKVASLQPIEERFIQLKQEKSQYNKVVEIQEFVDTNNNHLHQVIQKISQKCPSSFKFNSITTDNSTITMNATTTDRLEAIAVLIVQLSSIQEIDDVNVEMISETKDATTKIRQYTYSIVCQYSNQENTTK